MLRRIFCKLALIVVAIFAVLALPGVLRAQGNSDLAFEHVKQVQERNTNRLMELKGVEGTAIGLDENGQLAIAVFTDGPAVPGIPRNLEGVPVQVVITGKFYALARPTSPPGKDKKNPAPAPPTGLTASPSSVTEIYLDWNDNTESDLAAYKVYRGTSPGSYGELIASFDAILGSWYLDAVPVSGTYYYVVTAVDDAGKESDPSNEASATVSSVTEAPSAPTFLTATAVSSSQINLTWTDTSDNESGFVIERSNGGSYAEIGDVGADVTAYSDTGLNPSTTYTYRIYAYNIIGNSDYSDTSSDTTPAAPANPWRFDRPVPIGVSTGHPDITAGTLGCRVYRGGEVFALSNNHVYANENLAKIEDEVIQPGTVDGGALPDDYIGYLEDFEPIVFHPRANNTIDAAIASTTVDLVGNATPGDGYGTPSSTPVDATFRMAVQKYGRTTGLTTGTVAYVSVTTRVGYDSGQARFINQIAISPGTFSDGGDSGSLIVTDPGKNPVGLLFAGSSSYTIANPINLVLERFNVTIDDRIIEE